MPPSHLLLALAVVFVWGTNFVVIRWGLDELPPFLFASLRFACSALPWMLFVRRPAVRWRTLAAFGLLVGVGQFGLMFRAIQTDISPGLASLVVQSQVFFTIGWMLLRGGERLGPLQALALALAVAGIGVIAGHLDAHVTGFGLALMLAAAFCWACGNIVARSAGRVDAVAFMVWSSAFAAPPLFLLSLLFDGPAAIEAGLRQAGAAAWSAVAWQAIGNTLFGYAAWNWLLARHPAATVTPMALLVPVFGMSASAFALGEPMPGWKLAAAGLVMAGLALNVAASRVRTLPPA